jgi:hypothetical protein
MPPEALEHICIIGGRAPVTLRSLIDDYTGHLLHHVSQLSA